MNRNDQLHNSPKIDELLELEPLRTTAVRELRRGPENLSAIYHPHFQLTCSIFLLKPLSTSEAGSHSLNLHERLRTRIYMINWPWMVNYENGSDCHKKHNTIFSSTLSHTQLEPTTQQPSLTHPPTSNNTKHQQSEHTHDRHGYSMSPRQTSKNTFDRICFFPRSIQMFLQHVFIDQRPSPSMLK